MPSKLKDLTGKKFGKLTVLRRHDSNYVYYCNVNGVRTRKTQVKWVVLCECGKEYVTVGERLKFCKMNSCRDCSYAARQMKGKISYKTFYRIKKCASDRGIAFSDDITREYLDDLMVAQNGLCAISGIPIFLATKTKHCGSNVETASLDRIDSKLSYTRSNVQWVDKRINFMKQSLNQTEFIELCSVVAKKWSASAKFSSEEAKALEVKA